MRLHRSFVSGESPVGYTRGPLVSEWDQEVYAGPAHDPVPQSTPEQQLAAIKRGVQRRRREAADREVMRSFSFQQLRPDVIDIAIEHFQDRS